MSWKLNTSFNMEEEFRAKFKLILTKATTNLCHPQTLRNKFDKVREIGNLFSREQMRVLTSRPFISGNRKSISTWKMRKFNRMDGNFLEFYGSGLDLFGCHSDVIAIVFAQQHYYCS